MTVVVNAFFEVRNATLTPRGQYKIWDLALLCGLFHHRLRYKYAFDGFCIVPLYCFAFNINVSAIFMVINWTLI